VQELAQALCPALIVGQICKNFGGLFFKSLIVSEQIELELE
jgi:hypothetical protein